MKCKFCGSENTKINTHKTVFCLDCNICLSRSGKNPQRMVGHDLYEGHGYRIALGHPDYIQVRQKLGLDMSGELRVKNNTIKSGKDCG